jgi:membrane-associated protease RseP (regulator of RpoE activity)
MAKASGSYLLLAALVGGAFILVLLWNREQRALPAPGPVAPGLAGHSTGATPDALRPAAGQPMQSAPAAAPDSAGSAPDSAEPPGAPALPPLEARQLAKIAHGMRPNPAGGILIEATPPGSVAGQLRLQPGDVIVSVDGVPVTTPEEFARTYAEQGLPRELTILRNGMELHRH